MIQSVKYLASLFTAHPSILKRIQNKWRNITSINIRMRFHIRIVIPAVIAALQQTRWLKPERLHFNLIVIFFDIKPILTVYRDKSKRSTRFLKTHDHLYVICLTHVLINQTLIVITMAKPTSAFFRAGPSLVPSPVTATTCLCSTILLSMMPKHKKTKNRPFSVCLCCWVYVCACVHVLPTFDQCVFVSGWWPSQNTQLGPDFVNALLFNLRRGTDGERAKEERVINLNSSLLPLDVTALAGFNCIHMMEERKGTHGEAGS